MALRKKLLKESSLYLILDKKTAGSSSLFDIASKARDSGVDIVQFRDKQSGKESIIKDVFILRKLLYGTRTLFLINDYLDVAKITDADGLHIGQSDTSIEIARQILGPDKIIGVSCHNIREALQAQDKGADYIGIGPLFPTPTKPEYKPIGLGILQELRNKIMIPFFAIGGVNLGNIHKIVESRVRRAAVCRAILKSKNVTYSSKKFQEALRQ